MGKRLLRIPQERIVDTKLDVNNGFVSIVYKNGKTDHVKIISKSDSNLFCINAFRTKTNIEIKDIAEIITDYTASY